MTFLKYLTIQVLAYGIDMGTFLLILHLKDIYTIPLPIYLSNICPVSGDIYPILANVIAKLMAGCFAFVAHRYFTFKVADSGFVWRQAVRYFLVLAINVPFASALLGLILVWLPLPVVAKFISDVICVVISYFLSKKFIFTIKTIATDDPVSSGSKI